MAATRFQDLLWADPIQARDIKIYGLGGVGSWLLLFLSRVGIHNIIGYDRDTLEDVNIGNSMLLRTSIRTSKAAAALSMVTSANVDMPSVACHDLDINLLNLDENVSDIVISAVDDMPLRNKLFESFMRTKTDTSLFIDCRMASEVGTVLAVWDEYSAEYYRSRMFANEEAEHMACGNKATSLCSAGLSVIAGSIVNNWIINQHEGFEFRNIDCETKLDLRFGVPITTVHGYL